MPETQAESKADQTASPGILDRIVRTKLDEIARLQERASELDGAIARAPEPRPFRDALRGGGEVALIAEVKRRSPGAGEIRPGLDPLRLASSYEAAGARAISVLTDAEYFGGSLADLTAIRRGTSIPILRKDFTLDPLQVREARAGGADAILLIVRLLDDEALRSLRLLAEELGMAALVEAHDAGEVERALRSGARIIGVNNRDLATFTTRLEISLELLPRIPPEVVFVSESGIRSAAEVSRLGAAGADAILVGETLLRATDPGAAARKLTGHPRAARPPEAEG